MTTEKKSRIGERQITIRKLLEGLVAIDKSFLKKHHKRTGENYPSLYDVAPTYHRCVDRDFWQDVPSVVESGRGDAIDLVCWRIAELRLNGYEDAVPFLSMKYHEGSTTPIVRVRVRVGDLIEDPASILGYVPEA